TQSLTFIFESAARVTSRSPLTSVTTMTLSSSRSGCPPGPRAGTITPVSIALSSAFTGRSATVPASRRGRRRSTRGGGVVFDATICPFSGIDYTPGVQSRGGWQLEQLAGAGLVDLDDVIDHEHRRVKPSFLSGLLNERDRSLEQLDLACASHRRHRDEARV